MTERLFGLTMMIVMAISPFVIGILAGGSIVLSVVLLWSGRRSGDRRQLGGGVALLAGLGSLFAWNMYVYWSIAAAEAKPVLFDPSGRAVRTVVIDSPSRAEALELLAAGRFDEVFVTTNGFLDVEADGSGRQASQGPIQGVRLTVASDPACRAAARVSPPCLVTTEAALPPGLLPTPHVLIHGPPREKPFVRIENPTAWQLVKAAMEPSYPHGEGFAVSLSLDAETWRPIALCRPSNVRGNWPLIFVNLGYYTAASHGRDWRACAAEARSALATGEI